MSDPTPPQNATPPDADSQPYAPWLRLMEAARAFCTSRERLYFFLKCLDKRVNRLKIRRQSQILIEGFARSGNTFSVVAFEHLQGKELGNGHHLHTLAHIRRAIRFGKPILIVIRKPEDVVTSASLRMNTRVFARLLDRYIRYHAGVLSLSDHLVLETFQNYLQDPTRAISLVNKKFGTRFVARPLDEADHSAIKDRMEEIKRKRGEGEMAASLPSEAKDRQKETYLRTIRQQHPALLARAGELHARLASMAANQG